MSISFRAYDTDDWLNRGSNSFEAACPNDIEDLEKKIANLKKSLALRITANVVNDKEKAIFAQVNKIKKAVEKLKSDLKSMLENGKWKSVFHEEIEATLSTLERRYNEMNVELDKKIMKLSQVEVSIENIKSAYLSHEKTMLSQIEDAGECIRKKIANQNNQGISKLFTLLNEEAKNITWRSENE